MNDMGSTSMHSFLALLLHKLIPYKKPNCVALMVIMESVMRHS